MTIDNQRLQLDAAELQGYLGSGQATRAAAMLQCEYDSNPQEAVILARAAAQQGSNYPLHVRIDSDGSVSVFDNNVTAQDPSGYGTYAVKMSELAEQAAQPEPPASEVAPAPLPVPACQSEAPPPVPAYQPEVQAPPPPPTSLYPSEVQPPPPPAPAPYPYPQQTEIPPPIEQQTEPPQLQSPPDSAYYPQPSEPSVGEQIVSAVSGIGEGLGALARGLLSGGLSISAGRRGTFVQLGAGNFIPGYGPNYIAAPTPYYQSEIQRPWQYQSEFAPPQQPYWFSENPQDPLPFPFAGPPQYDQSQQSPDGSPMPPPDGPDYQQYDDPNQFKS